MSVELIRTVAEVRTFLADLRRSGKVIGLVPTMGALHEGHGGLIERARAECDVVLVSLFVNPIQFGPEEDLSTYPRSLDEDLIFCDVRRVDAVFAPSNEEVYPEPLHTFVEVGLEAENLCGPSRPGHFRGVATVVLKLLNIIQPHYAYFGEKDIQQLAVVQRMVRDLNLPVRIVGSTTSREPDGLAISSRNQYLSTEERQVASVLYRALRVAGQRIGDGSDPNVAKEAARKVFAVEPLARVDYLEIVDPIDMQPVDKISGPVRAVGAMWIGETRLIDNVLCKPFKKGRRPRS